MSRYSPITAFQKVLIIAALGFNLSACVALNDTAVSSSSSDSSDTTVDTVVTASNDGGEGLAAPSISSPGVLSGLVGQAITSVAPVNNGGLISTCTITPDLEADTGLTFDASTCSISGTPTRAIPLTVYTLSASNATGSSTITISAQIVGSVSAASFSTQPGGSAVAAASLSTQPAVQVVDSSGNGIAGVSVTLTAFTASGCGSGASAAGTLANATATTNTSGIATFTSTSYTKAETIYLKATAGSASVCSSGSATVTAGTGSVLSISTAPSASALAGVAFATQPVVKIYDSSGNLSNSSAVVTLTPYLTADCSTTAATGTLGSNTATASGGTATFAGVNHSIAETIYIKATSGSLTSACTAATTTVTAPVATKISFSTQPVGAAAGSAFATQPVVTIQDADNNTVTSSSATVTLAIGTNPSSGTLGGIKTVTAVNGVATFSGLWLDNAGAGYTLTATSGSLTSATSSTFTMSAAATQSGDPYWASVVLSMNMDQAAGAFTDATGLQTVTNTSATTVTGNTGFGNAAQFDATKNGVSVPTNARWVIGTGDYTGELRAKFDSLPASGSGRILIGSLWSGHNTNWMMHLYCSGANYYLAMFTRSGVTIYSDAFSVSTGVWYSFAFSKSGTTTYFFKDGTSIGSGTINYETDYAWVNNLPMMIGSGVALDYITEGQIDDVRLTQGLARYTASYTPSAGPLPTSITPANKLVLSGPGGLGTLSCSTAFTVTAKNNVLASPVTTNTSITLSGLGSATAYSDSGCTNPATVMIPSGSSSTTFFLKGGSSTETLSVVASDATTSLLASAALSVPVTTDVDVYWSNVVLLANFDGANSATAFTDSKDRVFTFEGSSSLTTSTVKYGTASAIVPLATKSRISTPFTSNLAFGTNDFTLEMDIQFNSFPGDGEVIGQNYYGWNYGWNIYENGSTVTFYAGQGLGSASAAWAPTLNTWYHLALSRNSNSLRFFVNGTQIGATATMSDNIIEKSGPLVIGRPYNTDGQNTNIALDNLRITNGIGRYTADFTAPAAAFRNY